MKYQKYRITIIYEPGPWFGKKWLGVKGAKEYMAYYLDLHWKDQPFKIENVEEIDE